MSRVALKFPYGQVGYGLTQVILQDTNRILSMVSGAAGGLAMVEASRKLMSHGMLLFVLGLLTGFAEQHFVNMRMALAAHLEGILNGIFLLALGAAWNSIWLSPRKKSTAYWTVLYGTYANWLFTTRAAVFGTAALSPITAAGHSGTPWQERLVTAGFMTVGIAILSGSVLLFAGFRNSPLPKALQPGTAQTDPDK